MASAAIKFSRLETTIGHLVFDLPEKGANILSGAVLEELAAHLDQIEQQAGLTGLILSSAKPGIFIAGADLTEFVASIDQPAEATIAVSQTGQKLFARLSQFPFPSVAAIDGLCLGGGAELAIGCDRRLVTTNSKCQIGFSGGETGTLSRVGRDCQNT